MQEIFHGISATGIRPITFEGRFEEIKNWNSYLVCLTGSMRIPDPAQFVLGSVEAGWSLMDFSYRPFDFDESTKVIGDNEQRVATVSEVFEATHSIVRSTGLVPFAYLHVGDEITSPCSFVPSGSKLEGYACVSFAAHGDHKVERLSIGELRDRCVGRVLIKRVNPLEVTIGEAERPS